MTRKVIAAMRISSFFYSIKQGIKNIWRNKMFSIASIATMCACKETYFGGSEEAAEGFAENPLANSASYEIYMKDVSMQDALVTYLESLDGVREVHHSAVVANTLSDFNKLIAYVSGGIILILLAVAIFLISNTVRVGI